MILRSLKENNKILNKRLKFSYNLIKFNRNVLYFCSNSSKFIKEETKKVYFPVRRLTKDENEIISKWVVLILDLGELGANYIYEGQYFVLSKTRPDVAPIIMDMWNQEKKHLETFNELLIKHKVRATELKYLCKTLGFALGVGSALLGTKSAMACTEAVETVIGEHYNDQLRETMCLKGYSSEIDDLREKIKKFRDEELEHLDIAVNSWDSKGSFAYGLITNIVKAGCIAAIWVCKRI
ncbi:hypothetical protein PNEG_00662 [Pneumocystis murina B123]|uniref:5-demethoxyubiquinone hydroxylase, mitochondrial n=1 Tax=Pneumocystis murina (strain B123) TaxID=1069680 RepID=M7PB09_PNEMU|nr:hypothetical protein PNEG_00662 [Pneumocystis murina B123]EMR11065.1 hypothetical protein PNEG_00662 [Pneumocystis murina B123]